MKYQQHPLSAAWSAMDDESFKGLIDDIDANGVRNPIALYDGMILDGWHRYKACLELNVKKPPMVEYDGSDPASFVVSMNFHRRSKDSPSQIAFSIARTASWVESSGRPSASVDSVMKMSVMKAAEIAGVSARTMTDAKAATKADPEVQDAVAKGEMSVSKAAKLAKKSPKKQRKALKKEPKAPVVREETVPLSQYTKLEQEHDELSRNYHALSVELSACEAVRNGEQVAELKKLHGQIVSLTQSRDEWQNKCAEQTRQLNYFSNKMKKSEK
jgi:ParB-like chromosome segregation protein Spo0J